MLKATSSYIEGLTTALATNSKVKFKSGNGWHANIKSKTLTYNLESLKKMPFEVAKGLILHETGHIKYTEPSPDSKLRKENPAIQDIYNALEDIRIEDRLNQDYGGFSQEALDKMNYYSIDQLIEDQESGNFSKRSDLNQILTSIIVENDIHKTDREMRIYSQDLFEKKFWDYSAGLGDKIRDELKKIDASEIINQVKSCASLKELKDYVDKSVYPLLKDQVIRANKKPDKMPRGLTETLKIGHSGKGYPSKPILNQSIPSDNELKLLLSPLSNTLAIKLSNILKENSTIRYTGSHLQGRLLSRNAFKVMTGDNRIFSRRNNPHKPDYAVTFILDESGSMQGKKHANAYIGTFLIKEACRKLNFKTHFIKYNDDPEKLADLSGYRDFRGGGNDDLRVCELVYNELDKAKDNLVFILTDGGICNDPTPILRKFNAENIPYFAVGVGLDSCQAEQLKQYYQKSISCPAEQIPEKLIGLMSKVIHR
jgi:hypothetical protein